MTKAFFVTDSRYKYLAIILFLMWIGFMAFFYMKAEEITKDPCSICARRTGETVECTAYGTLGAQPITKLYYPNGSIKLPDLTTPQGLGE